MLDFECTVSAGVTIMIAQCLLNHWSKEKSVKITFFSVYAIFLDWFTTSILKQFLTRLSSCSSREQNQRGFK